MKTFLLYVALVALPLLGVFAILRIGSRIDAPPDVAGAWRAAMSTSAPLLAPCVDLPVQADAFEVTQSGVHVEVVLEDPARTRVGARLWGSRLSGLAERLPLVGTARSVCPDSPLELAADVVWDGQEAELVGTLWAGGCAGCAPVAFRAERVAGRR